MIISLLLFSVYCLCLSLYGLRYCRKQSNFYRLNNLPHSQREQES